MGLSPFSLPFYPFQMGGGDRGEGKLWQISGKKKQTTNPRGIRAWNTGRSLQPGHRGMGAVCKAVAVPSQGLGCTAPHGAAGGAPHGWSGVGGKKLGQKRFNSILRRLLRVFSEISKHVTAFVVCLSLGLNASVFQSGVKASFYSF